MDEAIAGGTRYDSIGIENLTDIETNIGYAPGLIRNAAYLVDMDAGLTHVSDSNLSFNTDMSFSFKLWLYSENGPDLAVLIDKGDGSGTKDEYLIYDDGTYFAMEKGNMLNSYATVAAPDSPPVANQWQMVVGGYNSTNQQIFVGVDNGLYNTASWAGGNTSNTNNFTVGTSGLGINSFYGEIDEVSFYRGRALQQGEIGQIYTNELRGLTPLTYYSGVNGRNTIIFDGDARFTTHGSNTNLPTYFSLYSWASNRDANVVNISVGDSQLNDLTNRFSTVMSYVGTGTNVFWVTEIMIKNLYDGFWPGGYTQDSIINEATNYLQLLVNNGIRVIPLTIYDNSSLNSTQETVRAAINQSLTNFAGIFAWLDAASLVPTNGGWYYDESELNDSGNTNVARQLNAVLDPLRP